MNQALQEVINMCKRPPLHIGVLEPVLSSCDVLQGSLIAPPCGQKYYMVMHWTSFLDQNETGPPLLLYSLLHKKYVKFHQLTMLCSIQVSCLSFNYFKFLL